MFNNHRACAGAKLSLCDLAEILHLRGLVFSHEAVRNWEAKLAPQSTAALRQCRKGKIGLSWYVDETYLKVACQWPHPHRAIDSDGNLVEVFLTSAPPVLKRSPRRSSAVTVSAV
ncbi:DDE-type integrase/transposase/recombinase [Azospirillum sp. TSO35-2]|uniref:DDE-type integrase/transposase/recombinase n=1 Tax=Azospirillum sp. TSO35-2 TaxID=716796 RepID=UPI000D61686A|nr:DDE-type integrase/transposase/recombinase [Azospirillum sp. TSO35-2]PWC32774.1 hypothetical protein TSO352_19360 [Azospirillum sp. TSO35-2]